MEKIFTEMNIEYVQVFWTTLRPQDFIPHCPEERFELKKNAKALKESPCRALLVYSTTIY